MIQRKFTTTFIFDVCFVFGGNTIVLYNVENTVVGDIFHQMKPLSNVILFVRSLLGWKCHIPDYLKKVHPPSVSQHSPDKRSSQVITNAMSTPQSVCLQWTSAHAADHVTGHHRCQTMHSTVTTEFIALRKSLQP